MSRFSDAWDAEYGESLTPPTRSNTLWHGKVLTMEECAAVLRPMIAALEPGQDFYRSDHDRTEYNTLIVTIARDRVDEPHRFKPEALPHLGLTEIGPHPDEPTDTLYRREDGVLVTLSYFKIRRDPQPRAS
jgi:hypothetical protein